ncbi:hypothetical protein BLNAU_23543 [Blattamonas nauphoetae]|uniref:Uncharacterized protein n=1 Tax=Blattamonas nauphoetae TaxID=2049346 RepID=A0ABQ9WU30_9EUKA|nr:hypothetical protein BLNAU_23543 [Blattamonas nauphoetae]
MYSTSCFHIFDIVSLSSRPPNHSALSALRTTLLCPPSKQPCSARPPNNPALPAFFVQYPPLDTENPRDHSFFLISLPITIRTSTSRIKQFDVNIEARRSCAS